MSARVLSSLSVVFPFHEPDGRASLSSARRATRTHNAYELSYASLRRAEDSDALPFLFVREFTARVVASSASRSRKILQAQALSPRVS